MIVEAQGNLVTADAEALVNTVNTVGVMGKGIALQFKRAYPEMFKAYERAHREGKLLLGKMHVWPTGRLDHPRFIVNFPTKGHWRSRSHLGDIDRGLEDLVAVIGELGIRSIALPPLGCGNGGLDWADVRPLIEHAFSRTPDVEVLLFAPAGAPPAAAMPNNAPRPPWTLETAALVTLVDRYVQRSFEVSLIEVQKLMYFLQIAGEPLDLTWSQGTYGPYSQQLTRTVSAIEGHFTRGFGDGSQRVRSAEPLVVLPGVTEEAAQELAAHPDTRRRIDRVLQLSSGFESAYSMELLASVHWVAKRLDPRAEDDPSVATDLLARWSPRKRELFRADHVGRAWQRLDDHGWLLAREPA